MSYRKTGQLPPALLNKPHITPDYAFYINSFFFLSQFRGSNGYGPNPLSLPDIWEYCDRVGLKDPDMQIFFADVMHSCDNVYLEEANKAAKQKAQTSDNSGAKAFSRARGR